MQRPPHIGVSDPPDRTTSIELLVAALLGPPHVDHARSADGRAIPTITGHDPEEEDAMGYTYTNSKGQTYGLHSRTTESSTGKPRTLYYFSRTVEGAIDELPRGYRVVEARTGLPLLKRTG